MRLGDLLTVLPGLPAEGLDAQAEITGITADSRAIKPGMVFAALPGTKQDGRAFIPQALSSGAAAVLVPAGTAPPPGVAAHLLIEAADARQALARMAAAFHGAQPDTVVAVTGTNGKTSTVDFLRQIWRLHDAAAASIGTLGLVAEGFPRGPSLTTPDPVALHGMLADLARAGVGHAAMEASSHGLEQRRLDGVRIAAAGFTNLTRDHLDYHGSMEAYRAAKLRLFDTVLPDGAGAAASSALDEESMEAMRAIARRRRLKLATVGDLGGQVRLLEHDPIPEGQGIAFEAFGHRHDLVLPMPGRFQADNALMAATLATLAGLPALAAFASLAKLEGVRGRMELAARLPNGAAVYVDYAHTPDAIARLLAALRPHAAGRLHIVFGAGGDRDTGKRPDMGRAACAGADMVWVTDDNPRSEDPAAIRAAVLAGCPAGTAIGGRAEAIAAAMGALGPGDVLAVAGKGHEPGQEIGGVTLPFDDVDVVRRLAGGAA